MVFTIPLNDNSPMPFGKYQGKAMINVPAQYLLWLFNKGCGNEQVKRYIMENIDVLNSEVSRVKAY
jgi:uncharacterized protein (DUF3820 family)